jgi:hypothetical protein
MTSLRNLALGALLVWVLTAGSARAGALSEIEGQWHHRGDRCEDASATITVDDGQIRFDWVWEGGAKGQVEVERVDSVLEGEIRTTALETSGDNQEDRPGDRFRYTVTGDRLTIESLSGKFAPQVVYRCALSV